MLASGFPPLNLLLSCTVLQLVLLLCLLSAVCRLDLGMPCDGVDCVNADPESVDVSKLDELIE